MRNTGKKPTPTVADPTVPFFRKSSWSKNNPKTCVEVASTPEGVLVRDSKNPESQTLKFSNEEWSAFINGVKDGEFEI